jgi:hypothetical protein
MTSANIIPIEPAVAPPTMQLTTVAINSAEEANSAHRRIVGSVQDAIAIGEYLTMKKQSLPHGQWLPWCEDNIEFDVRTAQNYMRVHAKNETVSHLSLTDAYKLLSAPDPITKPESKSAFEPTSAKPPKKEPPTAYKPEEKEAKVESDVIREADLTVVQIDPIEESNRLVSGEVDGFFTRIERIISQNCDLKDHLVWNVKLRLDRLFEDSNYKIIRRSLKERQEAA